MKATGGKKGKKEEVVLGIDFDNTIINYDVLTHSLAVEKGLIPSSFPQGKREIRERIRQVYGDEEWQKIQAVIYGEKIMAATLKEGVEDFLKQCQRKAIPVYIVSHKTEYSNLTKGGTNFRHAAVQWMQQQGLFTHLQMPRERVYFTSTRQEKLQKIKELGCTHFIDDLEEVFLENGFPATIVKILYAPDSVKRETKTRWRKKENQGGENAEAGIGTNLLRMHHWGEIYDYFFS